MNPIGFSTGALALGDFRSALGYMRGKPFTAVELSAIRLSELPELIEEIPALDLHRFTYIALHAPSSFDQSEEPGVAKLLARVPETWKIILHPDTIHSPENWTRFGARLVLENMDRRKFDGRSADEMSRWFAILPDARFCLDLAHAQQWDTTLTEAYLLLKTFSDRLCQIHISQLDSVKYVEKAAVYAAKGAWVVYERLNRISPTPPSRPSGPTSPSRRAGRRRSRPSAGPAPRTRSVPSASPRSASRFSTASCPTKSCSTKRSAKSRPRSSSATARS
jgi:hypothetical protein